MGVPRWIGLPALAVSVALAGAAGADVAVSPDIAVDLSGTAVGHHEAAVDDLMGGIALETFGGLPPSADVDAYHEETDGSVLFSTDTTVSLGGGAVVAEPEDVVKFDGGVYSLVFDGSANGVPAGANVDAVTRDSGGDLILSFDVSVALPGGVTADDEDLVRFDGANWSLALDLSSLAVSPPFDAAGLDVDAVDARPGGVWALSFDTSGSAGGVTFDDEDVVEVDPSGPSVALAFDASAAHASWTAADLDAVMLPEPGAPVALAAGAGLLAGLARRRSRAR
jgi:hypothetical protein